MEKIIHSEIISSSNRSDFENELNSIIESEQKAGYQVTFQYVPMVYQNQEIMYTACITSTKEESVGSVKNTNRFNSRKVGQEFFYDRRDDSVYLINHNEKTYMQVARKDSVYYPLCIQLQMLKGDSSEEKFKTEYTEVFTLEAVNDNSLA